MFVFQIPHYAASLLVLISHLCEFHADSFSRELNHPHYRMEYYVYYHSFFLLWLGIADVFLCNFQFLLKLYKCWYPVVKGVTPSKCYHDTTILSACERAYCMKWALYKCGIYILPCAQGTCPLPPPPLSHCRSNFLPYSHCSGGGYILYGGGIYYLDKRYRRGSVLSR